MKNTFVIALNPRPRSKEAVNELLLSLRALYKGKRSNPVMLLSSRIYFGIREMLKRVQHDDMSYISGLPRPAFCGTRNDGALSSFRAFLYGEIT